MDLAQQTAEAVLDRWGVLALLLEQISLAADSAVSVSGMSDADSSDLFANRPDLAPDPEELLADGEVNPEDAAAMAKELAEARGRLLETEVSTVLVNHAFGIYELAAIHLTAEDPDLQETRLAIDALDALVTGLAGRLGDQEEVLNDAVNQIKMGYVQRVQAIKGAEQTTEPATD